MEREPQAVQTDQELAGRVKAYIAANKNVTRGELKGKLNTSLERLTRLHDAGLVKLPPKLSRGVAATLGRKKGKAFEGWKI